MNIKAKVVPMSSSLLVLGLGIMVNILGYEWSWWLGISLMALGIIGFLIAMLWNKLRYVVDAKYRRWRKLPSGAIIFKTEITDTDTNSGPVKITKKEVKKL